ncbi:MAG TPA: nitroreductase family protein [Hypericibacter adhaerens]|uniref:nitroreductase family protein n=1 Tax=Hypericibacter adhaerens TaxID=2602016 RepID=UPI002BB7D4C6|nr:nitroreductase family protein [Hypericibacter adhaerens]HWA44605.1 nitroreductase family protein [Hypericibacter adhaerens]
MTDASSGKGALRPIELPPPAEGPALSLHEAAARRRTTREIAATPLTPAQLSNLLWVAWGVNRKTGPFGAPGRTAASASNSQEIDLYVMLEAGAYLYDAAAHRLDPVAALDLRFGAIGHRQAVRSKAPVQLVYVVDLHRLTHTAGFEEPGLHDPEVQKSYYFVDTGLIAGNVYLFAAAHGLACWFHNCDKTSLTNLLALRPEQKPLFAQSIGWPAAADR